MSPSGKMIAVASFQRKDGGWDGEIEDLKTNIFVMNVEKPFNRKLVVKNGGWPTWGSDNVIFFHRKVDKLWGVFRANISNNRSLTSDTPRVTPNNIDARTPAAISDTKVAVATIRKESKFGEDREELQYRHIEIFEFSTDGRQVEPVKLTQKIRAKADHFNPFVIDGIGGSKRIGYYRCKSDTLKVSIIYHFDVYQNIYIYIHIYLPV